MDIATLPPAAEIENSTASEKQAVKLILGLYETARRHKEKRTGRWKQAYEFVRSRQWEMRPAWRASPVTNLVFSQLQGFVAEITDNRLRSEVLPRVDQTLLEEADAMTHMMDYEDDRDDMETKLEDLAWTAGLYSVGLMHTYWDPKQKRPVSEVVDPRGVFIDPRATDTPDCRYFGRVKGMSRYECETRWPKAKQRRADIKPGAILIPSDVIEDREAVGDQNMRQQAYQGSYSGGPAIELVPQNYDVVPQRGEDIQVIDCWIMDPSVQAGYLDTLDPDTGNPVPTMEPVYPFGRHVVLCGAVVVLDEKNELDHGEIPYVTMFCHRVSGEYWCISYVENLLDPQRRLNKIDGILLENAGRMANAQWLVPVGTMDDPQGYLSGEAGLVVEYRQGNRGEKPERMPGEPVPSFLMTMREMAASDMEEISGRHDVSMGKKPTGITAGVAIESLQQAGQTRLHPLVRHLEKAARRIGRQRLALIQQYGADEDRRFRVFDEATGEHKFVTATKEMIQKDWDYEIVAGSSLPKSRDQLFRQAIELKGLGVIDDQAVLDYMTFPGRQGIIRRNNERRRMAMSVSLKTGIPPAQIDPSAYSLQEAAQSQGGATQVGPQGPEPGRRPQVATRGGGFNNGAQ